VRHHRGFSFSVEIVRAVTCHIL